MKHSLLFALIFSTAASFAQTIIKGKVTDHRGEPVPMANVFLKDTYDGTTANELGEFQFSTEEKGAQTLAATMIGFHEFTKNILVEATSMEVSIGMTEMINELQAVTISAGAFTASDESRRTVFKAIDIATTAGATADIAGALNTLPGTQKVGESGRLFVRGGDGNEVRTFIDGMLVLDAYSPSAPNTPSRGRFLPFMFKGTSFSTGGYSAEYGQALSSTLVLDSKDETEATRTDIGILSVGGDVAHTQAWDGGSAGGKIQYTNLRPYTNLISQRVDWKTAPASLEGIGSVRQHVGKNGMAKVYGNFSRTDYSIFSHSIDDYSKTQLLDLSNMYQYVNGSYKDVLNDKWMIRCGISYSDIQNDVKMDEDVIRERETGVHGKVVVDGSISEHVELKTGVEVISRNDIQYVDLVQSDKVDFGFTETVTAAFAESDLYASNNFVTRVGVRAEHNNLQEKVIVDPRISLAYKTGTNGQVSVAYGTFRQSAKNNFLRSNPDLNSERAEHFIANYQRIENNRTFRIETYYKRYDDLVKNDGALLTNTGSGYAKGIELFWRDNESVDNLDYWISYSFLDTKRDYLNFPKSAVPSFASKHNLSLVGKYFFVDLKSQLGATFSIASGRPYNNPNSADFNSGKTKSYQDLSLNWSYLPKPNIIIHFSCTNVLGRDNIFGYEYSSSLNEDGAYNGRAIRQPAPRFLFLGILITLTKDKSINQLPTL